MSTPKVVLFLKRHPIGIISMLIASALAVAIYERMDLVDGKQQELVDRSAEGDKVFANVKNSAGLKEQVDLLAKEIQEIESRLISPEELGLNLQYFYRLERDTGVHFSGRQQAVGKKQSYVPVSYNISAQGTTQQVLEFLKRLENGQHFCRVQTANFTRAGTDISMNLQIELLGR